MPRSTVDAVIERAPGRLVLVRRRFPPLGWALPGGFVEYGESLEEACSRELEEETGLRVTSLRQFHSYSDPARDPRSHTITTVFLVDAEGCLRAGSDAAEVVTFPFRALPETICFDHRAIFEDYRSARWGISPETDRQPPLSPPEPREDN